MEKSGTKEINTISKLEGMPHLKLYNKADLLSLTKLRRFETKLGERIQVLKEGEDLQSALSNASVKYVLFGIPEDLGAKGNYGIGGTDTLWVPFLQSFLNIQSNDFF